MLTDTIRKSINFSLGPKSKQDCEEICLKHKFFTQHEIKIIVSY